MEESLKQQVEKQLHKANRKLRVARKNFADGFYEDTVSRAYYAMFHAAKALLLTKHLDAKTHAGLINLFNQHFVHTGIFSVELRRELVDAKELRETGDYDTEYEENAQDAQSVLNNAENFVKAVETYMTKQNTPTVAPDQKPES